MTRKTGRKTPQKRPQKRVKNGSKNGSKIGSKNGSKNDPKNGSKTPPKNRLFGGFRGVPEGVPGGTPQTPRKSKKWPRTRKSRKKSKKTQKNRLFDPLRKDTYWKRQAMSPKKVPLILGQGARFYSRRMTMHRTVLSDFFEKNDFFGGEGQKSTFWGFGGVFGGRGVRPLRTPQRGVRTPIKWGPKKRSKNDPKNGSKNPPKTGPKTPQKRVQKRVQKTTRKTGPKPPQKRVQNPLKKSTFLGSSGVPPPKGGSDPPEPPKGGVYPPEPPLKGGSRGAPKTPKNGKKCHFWGFPCSCPGSPILFQAALRHRTVLSDFFEKVGFRDPPSPRGGKIGPSGTPPIGGVRRGVPPQKRGSGGARTPPKGGSGGSGTP